MIQAKSWRWLLVALLGALLAGCATGQPKMSALDSAQYAWSAAIRWGDFEGAWNLLDSEYRDKHPLTDLELSRYKQVQVSGYHELGSQVLEDRARREIEIGVINRNTMAERSLRYTEEWRYDPATKTWWVTSGLPDFWAGE
ncbi:hypothetical protein FNZ56_08810 [Pseudoluteimonas lycopersici]|uniref:Uncharacterized protein n=1 Tax=Pseudoluteimonas lycopersici TaxID=1324796 RepID=A0A516V614_9GAMM|nr:hypothetical protein [Lysobacter lycopersici]QDQ73969.1 hypothetical protein FNZ56_08810 [Lysobacter lycopersici]